MNLQTITLGGGCFWCFKAFVNRKSLILREKQKIIQNPRQSL